MGRMLRVVEFWVMHVGVAPSMVVIDGEGGCGGEVRSEVTAGGGP